MLKLENRLKKYKKLKAAYSRRSVYIYLLKKIQENNRKKDMIIQSILNSVYIKPMVIDKMFVKVFYLRISLRYILRTVEIFVTLFFLEINFQCIFYLIILLKPSHDIFMINKRIDIRTPRQILFLIDHVHRGL